MFTNRSFYLMMIALIVTACAPQSLSTPPASEPASTIPPSVEPASATEPAVEPTIPRPTVASSTDAVLEGQFEVNGHSLYIKCLGTGSPTIVLEPGEGGTVSEISGIQKTLGKRTTTCAYDRANKGQSEGGVATPRTAREIVEDLHTLLATAKVPGPYVLVGSSAGGVFVQLYPRLYPDEVAGVVAINPVPPIQPWEDAVKEVFTEQEYAEEVAVNRGQNGEDIDYATSSEQITAAVELPNIPFEMVLSTSVQCEGAEICLKSYAIYTQLMQDVTAAWPRGNFSQVGALHNMFLVNPNAVVAVVERVLAAL